MVAPDPVTFTDCRGYNLLIGYVAVASPVDGTAMRHIIRQPGLDINHINKYGCSALWQAAHFKSHWKVFETLLSKGANPNQLTNEKETIMTRYLKGGKFDSKAVGVLL